jgi:hypothetical protein
MINPTKSLATLQQGDAMDKKPFFSTVEQNLLPLPIWEIESFVLNHLLLHLRRRLNRMLPSISIGTSS